MIKPPVFWYLGTTKFQDMSKVIQIPLTKGMFAMIDEEDFELVSRYKWYARPVERTHYANSKSKKLIIMHRLIMDINDPSIQIDHRNRDGLDNRRSNLRIATNSQNTCNRAPYKNRSSIYKGVYFDKKAQKWACQIRPIGGKTKHVGYFISEIEAALRYNEVAIKYHGEFAYINQIIPIV